MDEKRRLLPLLQGKPWERHFQVNWSSDPSEGVITKGIGLDISSLEKTVSRGHAWPSANRGTTDVGGNFSTSKVSGLVTNSAGTIVTSQRSFGHRYIGQQFAYSPLLAMDAALARVVLSSPVSLDAAGSTAISRCIPTNPVVDAGVMLGELKMGLPKLIGKELFKTKFKDYRKVGSEYLNVQFGWLPLISDLQKSAKAVLESEKILKQLERDSGKNVRRKYTFPEERTYSKEVYQNRQAFTEGGAAPRCFVSVGGAPLTVDIESTTKTWFSGCFTYYLVQGSDTMSKFARFSQEARKLSSFGGSNFNPEGLWNLAPWSWLVDWNGNIGNVLHNVTAFSNDGLVMRYGYVMQEKSCKITYTLHPSGSLGPTPKELKLTVTAISKNRQRATPFGFGFDMAALTGRQSAILGALAISRGPRHL